MESITTTATTSSRWCLFGRLKSLLLDQSVIGILTSRRANILDTITCTSSSAKTFLKPFPIHRDSNMTWTQTSVPLKALYTFGNCQRPVFSLGVSHHKHKITSLWKFGLNWSSKLRENDERKNTLVGRICVLSDRNKRLLARSLLLF